MSYLSKLKEQEVIRNYIEVLTNQIKELSFVQNGVITFDALKSNVKYNNKKILTSTTTSTGPGTTGAGGIPTSSSSSSTSSSKSRYDQLEAINNLNDLNKFLNYLTKSSNIIQSVKKNPGISSETLNKQVDHYVEVRKKFKAIKRNEQSGKTLNNLGLQPPPPSQYSLSIPSMTTGATITTTTAGSTTTPIPQAMKNHAMFNNDKLSGILSGSTFQDMDIDPNNNNSTNSCGGGRDSGGGGVVGDTLNESGMGQFVPDLLKPIKPVNLFSEFQDLQLQTETIEESSSQISQLSGIGESGEEYDIGTTVSNGNGSGTGSSSNTNSSGSNFAVPNNLNGDDLELFMDEHDFLNRLVLDDRQKLMNDEEEVFGKVQIHGNDMSGSSNVNNDTHSITNNDNNDENKNMNQVNNDLLLKKKFKFNCGFCTNDTPCLCFDTMFLEK